MTVKLSYRTFKVVSEPHIKVQRECLKVYLKTRICDKSNIIFENREQH